MARLSVEGGDLIVQLSFLEMIGALAGDVRVPLAAVRKAYVSERPWTLLRGMRVGTGIPRIIVLGRMIYTGGKDFVAIYGTGPAMIVELADGSPYQRIFVSGVDRVLMQELAAVGGERPSFFEVP